MSSEYLFPLTKPPNPIGTFGVADLETLTTLDRCYLAGYKNHEGYRFFESEPREPQSVGSPVDQLMRWILNEPGLPKTTYFHNGGAFDFVFIVRWLLENQSAFTRVTAIPIQSSILSLKIELEDRELTFLDSYRMCPMSLQKAADLFGLGSKLEVDYETLHLNPERFAYLKQDCELHYEVITRWDALIRRFGGQCRLSAASTSLDLFRRHYQQGKIARHCDYHSIFRAGYYGGRVERFRLASLRAYYYDVNSMYPWAMTHGLPYGDVSAYRFRKPKPLPKVPSNAFVTGLASVPTDSYIGPIPFRNEKGKLNFPRGTFYGTWASPDLENLYEAGGTIEASEVLQFRGSFPVFKNFVEGLYQYRDKSSPTYSEALSRAAKDMMNHSYGKYGTDPDRTKIIIGEPPDDEEARPAVGSPFSGVWFVDNHIDADYIIPYLAAWVTSLARQKLFRLLKFCHDAGHEIYYCDTDSLVTTMPPSEMPDIGTKLGQLKLEHELISSRYLAPKLYQLVPVGSEPITKAKGFSRFAEKLEPSELEQVLAGEKVDISRMTKVREGLRKGTFPKLFEGQKHATLKYDKRITLPDGNSIPFTVTHNVGD